MKTETVLKQLKKEYRSIVPQAEFQKKGWEELRGLLDEKNRKYWFPKAFAFRWVVVFLILFLASGGTIVAAAQKASPGDTLYPVKQFSQYVVGAVTQSKILPVTPKIPEVDEPLEERKAESSPSAGNEKREEKEKIKHEIEKVVEEREKKIELPIKLEVKGEEVKKEEKREEKKPIERVEEKVKDVINNLTQ